MDTMYKYQIKTYAKFCSSCGKYVEEPQIISCQLEQNQSGALLTSSKCGSLYWAKAPQADWANRAKMPQGAGTGRAAEPGVEVRESSGNETETWQRNCLGIHNVSSWNILGSALLGSSTSSNSLPGKVLSHHAILKVRMIKMRDGQGSL